MTLFRTSACRQRLPANATTSPNGCPSPWPRAIYFLRYPALLRRICGVQLRLLLQHDCTPHCAQCGVQSENYCLLCQTDCPKGLMIGRSQACTLRSLVQPKNRGKPTISLPLGIEYARVQVVQRPMGFQGCDKTWGNWPPPAKWGWPNACYKCCWTTISWRLSVPHPVCKMHEGLPDGI